MQTLRILSPLILAALLAGGCSKHVEHGTPAPTATSSEDLPTPEEAGLVSPEEAAQEADAITPQSADDELQKLQDEVGG